MSLAGIWWKYLMANFPKFLHGLVGLNLYCKLIISLKTVYHDPIDYPTNSVTRPSGGKLSLTILPTFWLGITTKDRITDQAKRTANRNRIFDQSI